MEGENASGREAVSSSATADAVFSPSSANAILVIRGSKKEEGAPVLKQLNVNKYLLAGHSPVFEELFLVPYKERDSNCFEIVEPRADTLETLIGLLELKDSVVVNKTNVDALLSLSDQYNVGVVHKKCVDFNLQMAEKHHALSHQNVGLNPDDPSFGSSEESSVKVSNENNQYTTVVHPVRCRKSSFMYKELTPTKLPPRVFVYTPEMALKKGQEYLMAGDYRQASEKGWMSASLSIKQFALRNGGYQLLSHRSLGALIEYLKNKIDLRDQFAKAEQLHTNFYNDEWDANWINHRLTEVNKLVVGLNRMNNVDLNGFYQYCVNLKVAIKQFGRQKMLRHYSVT